MSGLFDTRSEMVEAFEALVAKRYELLHQTQRLDWQRNLLKTYLVEVDGSDRGSPLERLRELASLTWSRPQVSPTDDAALFKLFTGTVSFMVDVLDSRFWALHSVDAAKDTDHAVLHELTQTSMADNFWMPSGFLRDVLRVEAPRGFSTVFDSGYFRKKAWTETEEGDWSYGSGDRRSAEATEEEDEGEDEDVPLHQLSMKMSGARADLVLNTIEGVAQLRDHLTLSRAKVRHGRDTTSLVEISFDGKLLCRGPSYAQYMDLINDLCAPYMRWLSRASEDLSFRTVQVEGDVARFQGEPILLTFPEALPDPEGFYWRLLSGARPFRLWGMPMRVREGYLSGTVSDLHGGGVLRMDLAPSFIRVYLLEGCCPNTVLRLLANLQQTLNSQVGMTAAGEDLSLRYGPRGSDVR